MTTTQRLVVGVFRDHAQAEQAINELLQAGFAHHQIHFAARGDATGGGILEKIKSLFTGQDISADGIYDDLVKMGTPPEDARYYQSEFEAGRSIVAIQGPGDMQKAMNMLVRHGGYGSNQRFAQSAAQGTATGVPGQGPATGVPGRGTAAGVPGQGSTTGVPSQGPATGVPGRGTAAGVPGQGPAPRMPGQSPTAGVQGTTTEEEQRVKLREEEIRARKQPVETGEAVLHKDVIAEEKSIEVPVTREEVYIERRPGFGLPSDQPIEEGETYRIPVREEQVTVEKVPVEREEVIFGKQSVQETQRVSGTVQREEAHIEQTGDVNVQERDTEQGRDIRQGRKARRDRDFERGGNIEDRPTP